MVNHDALFRAYTIILPVNTVPEHLEALGGGQTSPGREGFGASSLQPRGPCCDELLSATASVCITTSKRPDPV